MDWVWWGIPAETCGVSCTGWSRSLGRTCFFYLDSQCFFTLFYLMWLTFSPTQPLDLEKYCLSIHIFTLNDDGPSTLTLEEDEELSAANHWLLPAGDTDRKRQEGKFPSLLCNIWFQFKLVHLVILKIGVRGSILHFIFLSPLLVCWQSYDSARIYWVISIQMGVHRLLSLCQKSFCLPIFQQPNFMASGRVWSMMVNWKHRCIIVICRNCCSSDNELHSLFLFFSSAPGLCLHDNVLLWQKRR